jgi:hypothetical protein
MIGTLGLISHIAGALVVGTVLGIYLGMKLTVSTLVRLAKKRQMLTLLGRLVESDAARDSRIEKALEDFSKFGGHDADRGIEP